MFKMKILGTNESSEYRSSERFYNMLLIKRIDGGILVTDILWVLMLFINQILWFVRVLIDLAKFKYF